MSLYHFKYPLSFFTILFPFYFLSTPLIGKCPEVAIAKLGQHRH